MIDCLLAAPPYHSGHFAEDDATLRPGGLELTRHALQCAGFAAGQRIVDLGCGEASGTALLRRAGCLAIGVDQSLDALATAASCLAAEPAAVPLVAADAALLPFASASIDGMIAECALSLTGFSPAALAECQRVLRPGARLAITDVFARADDDGPTAPGGCPARLSGRSQIVGRLLDAGFRIERWENHSALLKAFVARLIFANGSLDSLWHGAAPGDAAAQSASLRRSQPGYFLLIASKPAKEACQ